MYVYLEVWPIVFNGLYSQVRVHRIVLEFLKMEYNFILLFLIMHFKRAQSSQKDA